MRTALTGVSHWHAARYVEGFRAGGAEIVAVEDADRAVADAFAASSGARAYADVAVRYFAGRAS